MSQRPENGLNTGTFVQKWAILVGGVGDCWLASSDLYCAIRQVGADFPPLLSGCMGGLDVYISQCDACFPVFRDDEWRGLCRYGRAPFRPRRMCGERRGAGDNRAEFPTARVDAEHSGKGGSPVAHPRPRRKCATSRDFHPGRCYILGRFALRFLVFPLLLQYALSPHL